MNPARIVTLILFAFAVFFVLRMVLRLRGIAPMQVDDLKARGAQVIDVRTSAEYSSGHAACSKNIPLDRLEGRLGELDRSHPIIVCCATGSRSAFAKTLLERAGFTDVHNAGPWQRVR